MGTPSGISFAYLRPSLSQTPANCQSICLVQPVPPMEMVHLSTRYAMVIPGHL